MTSTDPYIGALLEGRYRIRARLAHGGMGAVYEADDERQGRAVALKLLLPELRRDERMVKRFFREAKTLRGLSHPNIVQLLDCGDTDDGQLFLVMELLRGEPLDRVVPRDQGLPLERIVRLMSQMCAGVAAAHARGLIHRDLKPSNIFVMANDEVRVLDFGIAKPLGEVSLQLTQAGLVMGTPGFIAPEQITGAPVPDQRADVYALGALLYYLITGRKPFAGKTPQAVLTQQLTRAPDAIDFEGLAKPRDLEPLLLKAMAKEPRDRHARVADLAKALELTACRAWCS